MTCFSFIESCQRLSIDPKTLRQWLAQAQISLHPHPQDARIKCLTGEQVQVLARLHGRVLSEAASASPKPEEAPSGMSPTALSEAALRARLGQLEAQVAALQTQLTDLALQLRRRATLPHRTADARQASPPGQNGRRSLRFSGWLSALRAIPASTPSVGVPSY